MLTFPGILVLIYSFPRHIAARANPECWTDRLQIYLPIADLPVNVFLVLGMGLAVGYISGMFGIGGGFLMTPLLIFIGITPAVAVATVSSHIAASSFTGALSYRSEEHTSELQSLRH